MAVGIEHLGSEENLQIADEMPDDKQQQRGPGQGHEEFLPEGRVEQSGEEFHGESGARRRGFKP